MALLQRGGDCATADESRRASDGNCCHPKWLIAVVEGRGKCAGRSTRSGGRGGAESGNQRSDSRTARTRKRAAGTTIAAGNP